jgi:hypothetical protein
MRATCCDAISRFVNWNDEDAIDEGDEALIRDDQIPLVVDLLCRLIVHDPHHSVIRQALKALCQICICRSAKLSDQRLTDTISYCSTALSRLAVAQEPETFALLFAATGMWASAMAERRRGDTPHAIADAQVTAVLIEILEAADSAAVPSLSDDIGAVALVLQSMCDIAHRGTRISSPPPLI